MMATLIPDDESVQTSTVTVTAKSKLPELQAMVGGYIEFFQLPDGSCLMVNEEGKLRQMPFNDRATAITVLKGRPEPIVGPAVMLSREENEAMKEDDLDEDEEVLQRERMLGEQKT